MPASSSWVLHVKCISPRECRHAGRKMHVPAKVKFADWVSLSHSSVNEANVFCMVYWCIFGSSASLVGVALPTSLVKDVCGMLKMMMSQDDDGCSIRWQASPQHHSLNQSQVNQHHCRHHPFGLSHAFYASYCSLQLRSLAKINSSARPEMTGNVQSAMCALPEIRTVFDPARQHALHRNSVITLHS